MWYGRLGLRRFAPFSLPPRAIIDNEAGRVNARPLLLYTAPALEQARLAGYKTTTPDCRQALHCRDSVGIRTQDPQLRRLLLYPTELPNRSVIFEGANISQILGIDKQKCGKVRKLLLERLESLCLLLI